MTGLELSDSLGELIKVKLMNKTITLDQAQYLCAKTDAYTQNNLSISENEIIEVLNHFVPFFPELAEYWKQLILKRDTEELQKINQNLIAMKNDRN